MYDQILISCPFTLVDLKLHDHHRNAACCVVSDLVPLKTPKFFGRKSELEQIHQYFDDDSSETKIIVLYGLGGLGKTQLVLQYWTESAEQYCSRIWVDATSLETALESFQEVVAKLGRKLPSAAPHASPIAAYSTAKMVFADVKRWLSELPNCRWLMVIDNVEDLDLEFHIRDLLPACRNGRIIVTSTQSETTTAVEAEGIEISEIDNEAGRAILVHRFPKVPNSEEGKHLLKIRHNLAGD